MADTATRTSDQTYDLVSVLYHSLQASETHEAYIRDADGRGDQEVAEFFRDVQERHREIADRAKELLQPRLS
jgi:rubrerythrin